MSFNKYSADILRQRLKNKYHYGNGYCVLEEVNTSIMVPGTHRRLDMVVISTFPSMGLERMAIEIKVSRADLISELKDASKSNSAFEYFEKFVLAIPDKSLVKNLPIPKHWGVLVLGEKSNRWHQTPIINENAKCDVNFVARIVQKLMTVMVHPDDHRKEVGDLRENIEKYAEEHVDSINFNHKWKSEHYDELKKKVQAFEEMTGIRVQYAGVDYLKKYAKVIDLLSKGEDLISDYQIDRLVESVEKVKDVVETIKGFKADFNKRFNEEDNEIIPDPLPNPELTQKTASIP